MPDPDDLPGRLRSVLQVLYLMFNEGFAATTGPAVSRPTSPTRRSA
jgi:RNA polymerase sigma-70 factor, ECF subfamily